jgi:hypothetical protein
VFREPAPAGAIVALTLRSALTGRPNGRPPSAQADLTVGSTQRVLASRRCRGRRGGLRPTIGSSSRLAPPITDAGECRRPGGWRWARPRQGNRSADLEVSTHGPADRPAFAPSTCATPAPRLRADLRVGSKWIHLLNGNHR